MTIAYWCVLIAAYLPIVWTAAAKFSGQDFGRQENETPRAYLEKLTGWRARANWAQQNAFEAFPPFAAAVIIAHLCQVEQATIDGLAIAFIVFRILHGLCYIANKALLRSTVWGLAIACVIALFVCSA